MWVSHHWQPWAISKIVTLMSNVNRRRLRFLPHMDKLRLEKEINCILFKETILQFTLNYLGVGGVCVAIILNMSALSYHCMIMFGIRGVMESRWIDFCLVFKNLESSCLPPSYYIKKWTWNWIYVLGFEPCI